MYIHECAKHKEGIHSSLVVLQLSMLSITLQSPTFCFIFQLPEKCFYNPLSISQVLVYALLYGTVCSYFCHVSSLQL